MIAFMHESTPSCASRRAGRGPRAGRRQPGQDGQPRDGIPVVTDGPFAESKESLAGLLGRRRRERGSGRSRSPPHRGLRPQVRRGPPGRRTPRRRCDDGRPRSRTCCASSRRRSSARSSAGTASSTPARTPCRRRCSPRRCSGREGVPDNPRGWLVDRRLPAAGRRVAQRERPAPARGGRRRCWSRPGQPSRSRTQDDTLTLLFLCCHPALSAPSQLALTLRAVGGLTTAEIARRSWCRRPPWPSGSAAPSRASASAGLRFDLPPEAGARRAAARRAAGALPGLQRGLHDQLRARRCTGPT